MSTTIRQVIYVSQAADQLNIAELGDILRSACTKNAANSITGILLYNHGQFLQVIEGPPENIESLLCSLKLDRRHECISVLSDSIIPEREFEYWLMGFKDFSNTLPYQGVSGDRENIEETALVDTDFIREVNSKSKAITLLKSFANLD